MNERERHAAYLAALLVVSVFVACAAVTGASAQPGVTEESVSGATVTSSNVSIAANGTTGQTTVTVDAENGMSVADVNISVDTEVAEISSVDEGADVDSSDLPVLFEAVDQTPDSVLIEYTNIAPDDSVEEFELAVVEFEAQTDEGETVVGTNATEIADNETDRYPTVNEREGVLKVGTEDAFFSVDSLEPEEATVERGDNLNVTAEVENTGAVTEEKSIVLSADGENLGVENLELGPGETEEVEFFVERVSLEPGEFQHTVESEDDNVSGNLTVKPEPAFFGVSDLNAPRTAPPGDEIDVNATVENTGNVSDTQTIEFLVDGTVEDSESKTLAGGVNTTVEFNTTVSATGDVDVEIASEDDNETATVTIEGQADYQLSNLDPEEATVTEGDDPINISADVDNIGGAQGTQDLELTVENESGVQYSDTVAGVQLGAGANTTVEFTDVPAGTLSPGDYDHIVSSDNDTVEGNLTVEEPASFEVSDLQAPGTVEEGEEFDVNATVENTGEVDDTQTVEFIVNGTVEDSESVTLAGGDSTTVEFNTTVADVGDVDVEVASEDDSESATVTVKSGALFEEPLPAFAGTGSPPTNTQDLNATLYEDVDGDGDGIEADEGVYLWSDLVQNPNDYDSLTQAQVDALDWSGDGDLTPEDAVQLWSEKVQASP